MLVDEVNEGHPLVDKVANLASPAQDVSPDSGGGCITDVVGASREEADLQPADWARRSLCDTLPDVVL